MKSATSYVALTEIRRQLWSGHASVMVGSGFSRNADRASSTIAYPPDWNELGRGFVDRLYLRKELDSVRRVWTGKLVGSEL